MKRLKNQFRSVHFRQLLCSSLVFSSSLAIQTAMAGGLEVMPLTPGISITGALGDVSSGWADTMVPVVAFSPNSFLYLDPQGLYHNSDEYSGSVGAGFRTLTESAGILGAYVFGDYNDSQQGNAFWFVSPGIERLGDTVDLSVNGYFPVTSRRVNTGTEFASEMGDTSSIIFTGHDEFDQLVNTFESTGIGVDGEIGYRLPFLTNNTKLYLGGYYFSPKDTGSIQGGTARLEVPVNNFISLSVSDAYDNVFHNTVKGGITLSLWGRSTHFTDHSLSTRMVDPIQRNRVAVEGGSHTSQYIAEGEEGTGQELLLMSNIWFFTPAVSTAPGVTPAQVSLSECTAENPCPGTDVNSNFFAGINAISPNANMFLAQGTYNAINGELVMSNGQSMYGRTTDYKQAAQGNNRALLVGGLDLFGRNLIDSIRLSNDSGTPINQAVLLENNAQGVALNNLMIGDDTNNPLTAYFAGIIINNNSQINITNSTINVFTADPNQQVAGIQANGSGNFINISTSAINEQLTNNNVSPAGILNNGSQNNWAIFNSQILIAMDQGNPIGIDDTGMDDRWQLSHNQIQTSVTSTNVAFYSIGIQSAGSSNDWDLRSNKITVISPEGPIGIFSNGNDTIWNLEGNQVISTGSTDSATLLIFSLGQGNTWNLTHNLLSASSDTGDAQLVGVFEGGNSNFWTLTRNIIKVDSAGAGSSSVGIRDFFGTNSSWNLKNNLILTTNSGGFDFGIEDTFTTNSSWELTGNQVIATSDGGVVTGILARGDNGKWETANNIIEVNSSGASSQAVGFGIYGNANQVTSTNDRITVTATGSGANAFGFSASSFGQATNATVTLINDKINATSTFGNAYGIFDNAEGAGLDTWSLAQQPLSQILVSAGGTACKIWFNGSCVAP